MTNQQLSDCSEGELRYHLRQWEERLTIGDLREAILYRYLIEEWLKMASMMDVS